MLNSLEYMCTPRYKVVYLSQYVTCLHWSLLVFTGLHRTLLVFAGLHWSSLIFAGLHFIERNATKNFTWYLILALSADLVELCSFCWTELLLLIHVCCLLLDWTAGILT